MNNFWISKLIENGFKQINWDSFVVDAPELYHNYKPENILWFLKGPFCVAPRSDHVLHFLYGRITYDDKFSVHMKRKASTSLSLSYGWFPIFCEINRFIKAIPDDLVLCLDIPWAKYLIETYFKDS